MYTIRVFTSYRELEPKLESGRTEPIVPSEPRHIVSNRDAIRLHHSYIGNLFYLRELNISFQKWQLHENEEFRINPNSYQKADHSGQG